MSPTAHQDFGTPLLLEDYRPVLPPMTPSSPPMCASCHSPISLKRCNNCQIIHYCSTQCQTNDWRFHKLLCKQSNTTASRPDATYRRALYLSDNTEKPRFIWLKYSDDGRPLDKAKCFTAVSGDLRDVGTIAFHDRHVPYWIQISYDRNMHGRELKDNRCVKKLLSIVGESATGRLEWRGPLVAIGYDAEEGLSRPALDVGPDVLGPLVRYLRLKREWEGSVFVEQPQERYELWEWEKMMARGGSAEV